MVLALMGANEQELQTFLAAAGVVFVLLSAALAFGLNYWWKRHSVLGWFIRIIAVVIGGLAGVLCSMVMDQLPKSARDALPGYAIGPIVFVFALLGSWLALKAVNLFSKREA